MIKSTCKRTFTLNGKTYFAGDEIETDDFNVIDKLNELGYIEMLTISDFIRREKNKKEEVKENDTRKY